MSLGNNMWNETYDIEPVDESIIDIEPEYGD